jgi:phage terminase large subunit-like protein
VTEIQERLRGNLLLFGKYCLPNMYSVPSAPFHYELAKEFTNLDNNKLNIIAPRGHSKSSLGAAVLPLWHIATDPEPKFILLISKTEGHSKRLLQTIKDVLDYSVPFRQVYGYWGEHSAKKWSQDEVVLKDDTYILCRGTGQQVVGLKYNNQRPTLAILDDPEDINNTKTAEAMKYNMDWLLQMLLPGLDAKRGRVVVIGTPQHQNCIIEVLSGMYGWKTCRYQALPDFVMTDSELQRKLLSGEVASTPEMSLWHDLHPAKKLLEEKKSLESINRVSTFYREYQCQITGDEDQLFKESYIKYYEATFELDSDHNAFLHLTNLDGVECDEVRPINVFMGIDPASSTRQTADYSTIVPVGIDANHNRFVLPYFRKHVTPLALGDAVIEFYDRYLPQKTRIESVGYQEMLREYVRSKRYIPGTEIKEIPRGSKSSRLETMEPMFAQGKVFIQRGMTALVDEMLMYPRGKHDDLLDGIYYATKGNYVPQHAAKVVKSSRDDRYEEENTSNEWMTA